MEANRDNTGTTTNESVKALKLALDKKLKDKVKGKQRL